MKRGLFSRRTYGFLVLLGMCTLLLFRVSASYRDHLRAEGERPCVSSHMEYDKDMGIHGSVSSTAQLPLRQLLAERTSGEYTLCACGCSAGTSIEYLYWHTPQKGGECLFEREKVLVCKGCGEIQKRYPAEQLLHKSGDDSLPGLCPGP